MKASVAFSACPRARTYDLGCSEEEWADMDREERIETVCTLVYETAVHDLVGFVAEAGGRIFSIEAPA